MGPLKCTYLSTLAELTTGCQPGVESMDLRAWHKIFLEMNWSQFIMRINERKQLQLSNAINL